jgi:hypothetical protein
MRTKPPSARPSTRSHRRPGRDGASRRTRVSGPARHLVERSGDQRLGTVRPHPARRIAQPDDPTGVAGARIGEVEHDERGWQLAPRQVRQGVDGLVCHTELARDDRRRATPGTPSAPRRHRRSTMAATANGRGGATGRPRPRPAADRRPTQRARPARRPRLRRRRRWGRRRHRHRRPVRPPRHPGRRRPSSARRRPHRPSGRRRARPSGRPWERRAPADRVAARARRRVARPPTPRSASRCRPGRRRTAPAAADRRSGSVARAARPRRHPHVLRVPGCLPQQPRRQRHDALRDRLGQGRHRARPATSGIDSAYRNAAPRFAKAPTRTRKTSPWAPVERTT